MSADLIGWHDEHLDDHRRRMRNALCVSLAFHGLVIASFAVAPSHPVAPMPDAISVELISASAAAAATRPRPAKPTPKPEAPAPPEPPPPKVAPPVPKAPVQVLPEESPGRIRKVKPAPSKPKEITKVQPEPKPAPRRPKREKSVSYEDAMAALNDELGPDETADLLTPAPSENEESTGESPPNASDISRAGVAVSPELAKWNRDTQRLIQSKWVTPSNFRGRGLKTSLEIRLSASGDLVGTPRIVVSSGDPYFDDNALRALLTVAPLPPPPDAGRRIFLFRSEAN